MEATTRTITVGTDEVEEFVTSIGGRRYPALKVDKEIALDKWWITSGPRPRGEVDVKVISDEIVDQSRWETHHCVIVRVGSRFFSTTYSHGSTECQDSRPFEDDDFVTLVEVEPFEKIVTDYRLKEVKEQE